MLAAIPFVAVSTLTHPKLQLEREILGGVSTRRPGNLSGSERYLLGLWASYGVRLSSSAFISCYMSTEHWLADPEKDQFIGPLARRHSLKTNHY